MLELPSSADALHLRLLFGKIGFLALVQHTGRRRQTAGGRNVGLKGREIRTFETREIDLSFFRSGCLREIAG